MLVYGECGGRGGKLHFAHAPKHRSPPRSASPLTSSSGVRVPLSPQQQQQQVQHLAPHPAAIFPLFSFCSTSSSHKKRQTLR